MRRELAYQVMEEVMVHNHHAHLELKRLDLDKEEDQAFISALVYTSLQNYLYLDYQIDPFLKKNTAIEIRLVLIMALAQKYFMNPIPDYALVNESVELIKKVHSKHVAGVVNAVLKKILSQGKRNLPSDPVKALSIETSMPEWIIRLLSSQYSISFARDYAHYCQQIKPNYVRINPFKHDEKLYDHLEENQGVYHAKSSLFQHQFLNDGYVLIQDINSQEVVKYLELEEGMRVLDCCCGPGTKTTQIAEGLNNTGEIIGVELHESRSNVTVELLKRWGVKNTKIVTQDVLTFQDNELFDAVLLDAPCSGLGVLSHKHDLRYHIKPEELDELQVIQKKMLNHLATQVKVGGILVYATCTLNKKENEKQIESFLKVHDNYEMLTSVTLDPMARQGDGFYIAQCRRTW
ncbi:transcription antitermination factor NusB [Erysipelothrix urinaevulpis]|uniref:transcription antitermination factor NusB n=1 Tax=Erysipelothrix urinaevulpis TaxID=2683717 RepID=UPI00135B49CA|nr:transcription antitermination factor NusB [Erysipelothrix urinaevulpis]